MKKNTFVIIDDHPLYRSGISALVREGLVWSASARRVPFEGRQLLDAVEPTLAIVDISLVGEATDTRQ
jgi:DNA-binding NarL/FixJ family response regulator